MKWLFYFMIMNNNSSDQYAGKYDTWLLKNKHVLYSELKLVNYFLKGGGDIFSVGCGNGLFEMLLEKEYNISVKQTLELSTSLAGIASKRGTNIKIAIIENVDFGKEVYDTVLFRGTPCYIKDLQKVFDKSYKSLHPGGKIIVIDIPKESSYALLYNLAKSVNTWDHPLLKDLHVKDPYPIEFVRTANWRTTAEKTNMLEKAGFMDFRFAQTLTRHPLYSNNFTEEPREGFDCGDYVAICAHKEKNYHD
jgi:SAM-dependent methyltransferase